MIRDATEHDLPAIRAIYNDAVLNTTAIWNEQPVDLANRQAWFAARWGTRAETGRPDYRTVRFGPRFEVGNTAGDEPRHATLTDGHAGSVWNALWAQSLVDRKSVV